MVLPSHPAGIVGGGGFRPQQTGRDNGLQGGEAGQRLGAKLGNNPGFRRGEQVAQGAEIPPCPVVLFDSGKAMHDAGGVFRQRIAHPLRQGLV